MQVDTYTLTNDHMSSILKYHIAYFLPVNLIIFNSDIFIILNINFPQLTTKLYQISTKFDLVENKFVSRAHPTFQWKMCFS